jgi:hypothetical protein
MAQAVGADFSPETVALLKKVLIETEGSIPPESRSSETRVKLASGILAAAADGERDPGRLRSAGLRQLDSHIVIFKGSWLD